MRIRLFESRLRAALLLVSCCTLAVCLSVSVTAAENQQSADQLLIRAAQEDDLAAAREQLDAGADVNAASRYGATPLFFACGNGNVELVELLLAKGAEVNVTDTFYRATPLRFTMFDLDGSEDHLRIAELLVENGADGVGALLEAAVRIDNSKLARTVVETGRLSAEETIGALALAEESERSEIVAMLRGLVPVEDEKKKSEAEEPLALDLDKAKTYVGKYAHEGRVFEILLADEVLMVKVADQEPVPLEAVAADVFVPRGVPNQQLTFRGRGGVVEGAVVRNGTEDQFFARSDGDESTLADGSDFGPLPAATRTAAINWPRFRGQDASGVGDGQGVISTWNAASGKGVRWKTSIPGLAHSSPIVWEDRVFLTSAVSEAGDQSLRTGLYGDVDMVDDDAEYEWKVFALEKSSGEIVWQRSVSRGQPQLERHLKSTHANPTPVTDGKYLVVSFASEGLFCFDLDGNQLWSVELGLLASGWFYNESYEWGFSSSPIIHADRTIVQIDIQGGSYIAAFDLATGELAWKTDREEIPTWGTPAILPGTGDDSIDEVITNGTTIRGYDASTGAELWTLAPNSEITVASPVIANGLAYVTGGYPPARPIYAVAPGGRGDLSLPDGETSGGAIRWSQQRGGTYIPTPIVYREILYVLQNNGRMTAHRAATGELLYRQRVGTGKAFSASPIAADGRLYLIDEEGVTFVVRAGERYQLLETNELDEIVMSSPAISDGLILIRSAKHLWALGAKAGAESASGR